MKFKIGGVPALGSEVKGVVAMDGVKKDRHQQEVCYKITSGFEYTV